jgi:hypothetical protein
MKICIPLCEEDFNCLVRGGELKVFDKNTNTYVYIILQDIGFERMDFCISNAEKGIDSYEGHTKV